MLHSGLLSSVFVERRPKLAMVLQVCFTSVEYRRQNHFLYPAGCALPMQPGMGLGFMAARVQAADSCSVCPLLPPGPLVYCFSGTDLMNLIFAVSPSLQPVEIQLNGISSHVSDCFAPFLPSSFGLVSSVLYPITQVSKTLNSIASTTNPQVFHSSSPPSRYQTVGHSSQQSTHFFTHLVGCPSISVWFHCKTG